MALSSRLIFRASLMRNSLAACVSSNPSQRLLCAQPTFVPPVHSIRCMSTSDDPQAGDVDGGSESQEAPKLGGSRKKLYVIHPVEISIRYLNSNAYKRTYGDQQVWVPYRRNFKGQYPPETRESCVRQGYISTGSPCPICRDEYLVVDYMNPALLDQFISPTTGQIIQSKKTGVCQKVQFKLELEIMKAYDFGTLQFEVPHRHYDLKLYYPQLREQ